MLNFQITRRFFLILIAALSSLIVVSAAARQLQVTVTDLHGKPLPQAVVSTDQPRTEPAAQTAVIDQVNRLFTPFISVVQPGTQVSFPNSDNIRHQVYSFSPSKTFELPLYSNLEAPAITFEQPGIVVLGCNIHDHMRAYLYVSPRAQSTVTDANGRAQVNFYLDSGEVYVWYPGLGQTLTSEQKVSVPAGQTELRVQLPVEPQQQTPPEPSALQQRFNKLKEHAH
ncbi:methylamine utilization protein [Pseudidiomarina insulisalsae]|uniref:Methylamine utilization protein n=1 Tax=Pseudidiomarina insulisalsae TaxID=575789 RepID=A0A432YEU4_9GAMM|nr:methylamine utilization protein [Pseudidiomarina insulisalsae]RUO59467.1 methylamine utilization protein [Pseudidiomarina insulisalsae]